MITEDIFKKMALSFHGVIQLQHFNRIGFKVINKRMFATYLDKNNTANIFLTIKEQRVFCEMNSTNIYPVANKWGEKGATTFELNYISKEIIMEALISAYNQTLNSKSK